MAKLSLLVPLFSAFFTLVLSSKPYSLLNQQLAKKKKYDIAFESTLGTLAVNDSSIRAVEFRAEKGILKPNSSKKLFPSGPSFAEYVKGIQGLQKCVSDKEVQEVSEHLQKEIMLNIPVSSEDSACQSELLKATEVNWKKIQIGDMHLHMNATFPLTILIQYLRDLYNGGIKNEDGISYMDEVAAKEPAKEPGEQGREWKLREIFEACKVTQDSDINAANINMSLNVSQGATFKQFLDKGTPFGNALMRQAIFIISSPTRGVHLANLLKLTLDNTRNEMKEVNMGLFGKDNELDDWANWAHTNNLFDEPNLKFKFQTVRVKLVNSGAKNYNEYLERVFLPIAKASLPIPPNATPDQRAMHKKRDRLLSKITAFDSAGEELEDAKIELQNFDPKLYEISTDGPDPSYLTQVYYTWANLRVVNQIRRMRRLNTIAFTPHCGESGPPTHPHLAGGFLLSSYVGHGIALQSNPVYKLLYTLTYVGATVCPFSNDRVYLPLADNPIQKLLHAGLLVTITTDDPTIFHGITDDPLWLEFKTVSEQFNLSLVEIILLLRNGAKLSGFKTEIEKAFENVKDEKWVTALNKAKALELKRDIGIQEAIGEIKRLSKEPQEEKKSVFQKLSPANWCK